MLRGRAEKCIVEQLTKNEREGAAAISSALAVAGLAMLAAGHNDPLETYGALVRAASIAAAFAVISGYHALEPSAERLRQYYDDPTGIMQEDLMVSSECGPHDAADLPHRLRNLLLGADLNCDCRQALAGTLDRFAAFEQRRMSRSSLALARDQKARIVNLLQFLSDLDDLTEGERDRTVFEEMALLFVDIAECANAGAAALHALQGANG